MDSAKTYVMNFKKLTILIIIVLNHFGIFAQNINIDLSNPYPRVGHEFEVNIDLSFLEDIILEGLDSSLSVINSELGETKLKLVASETGQLMIGPYKFKFNGKKISTDTLLLNISESLGMEEGLWISKYSTQNWDYLILEEIAKAKWINENEKKIPTHTLDIPKSDKAILLDDKKRNLSFTMITGRYLPLTENLKNDYSTEIIYYSREIYIVDNPDNIKISLNSKNIKNKPQNVYISDELLLTKNNP